MFAKRPDSPAEIGKYLAVSTMPDNGIFYSYDDYPSPHPRPHAILRRTIKLGEAVISRGTRIIVRQDWFINGEPWASIRTTDRDGNNKETNYFTPTEVEGEITRRTLATQGLWYLLVRPDAEQSNQLAQRIATEEDQRYDERRANYEEMTGLPYIQAGG